MDVLTGLAQIRAEMDQYVVGHDDVKEGILLGVIAREHIYLEGPPGTAKTMLAEVTSDAAELKFFFYQLHRDTRLAELVGDTVIFRERDESGGEIIRQVNRKGGILTSEICVLDDISRAPGEALNVLLRVLNERKFGDDRIPLLTAIATGNPTKEDYYNEPPGPGQPGPFHHPDAHPRPAAAQHVAGGLGGHRPLCRRPSERRGVAARHAGGAGQRHRAVAHRGPDRGGEGPCCWNSSTCC